MKFEVRKIDGKEFYSINLTKEILEMVNFKENDNLHEYFLMSDKERIIIQKKDFHNQF